MLSVEDWAEIRRLHRAEGLPIKAVAQMLGISKNTVKTALASDEPPKYERPLKGSIVDEVEPRIRELLQGYPRMPATVIAERIGWTRSIRVLSARVAELRPVYLPPDPASRTAYAAGEIAQCDFWFPDIEVPVGAGQVRTAKQLPVLTMVCAYSRWLLAMLLPSRHAQDLFAGWWRLIHGLGAVPRVLVWDGEGAIGRWRGGRSELTTECQAFRGTLAAKVLVCRPADPRQGAVGADRHRCGWRDPDLSACRTPRDRCRCAVHRRQGPASGRPLTPAGLRTVFRYHRERSGVAAGHPHALRHSFGTALAEAGVDLSVIQALMGHDHVDSAAAYIHLAPSFLREEFDAARARLRARS